MSGAWRTLTGVMNVRSTGGEGFGKSRLQSSIAAVTSSALRATSYISSRNPTPNLFMKFLNDDSLGNWRSRDTRP